MNDLLSNLTKNIKGISRSLSSENKKGEKGQGALGLLGTGSQPARELGEGWKVSPSIHIKSNEKILLGEILGSGVINHIWCTCFDPFLRGSFIQIYFDNHKKPAVQAPLGDFFCQGLGVKGLVNSLPVIVAPNGGLNSYFKMPFNSKCQIYITNMMSEEMVFYYQIDYMLTDPHDELLYFQCYFNRSSPLLFKENHIILPKIEGNGHYVGTYLTYQPNNNGWWGEGEVKFFMDGDKDYPTICGTGTEDYFGGAWNFEYPRGKYHEYSTPFLGLNQIIRPDGLYIACTRFSMYRWHIFDPICFKHDLKVTIQALGWRSRGRYNPLQDCISSVAYWYSDKINNLPELKTNFDLYEII